MANKKHPPGYDPYAALGIGASDGGIPNSARTHDEIKEAYKYWARHTHPDAGGSAHDFNAVKQAYDVLSDPKRRAHYDETGEALEAEADNADVSAYEMIGGFLQNAISGDSDPQYHDLIRAMTLAIDKEIEGFKNHITVMRRARDRVDDLVTRISHTKTGVDNNLTRMLQWNREQAVAQVKLLWTRIKVAERAKEILKDYNFHTADKFTETMLYGIGSSSTATTNRFGL